MRLANVEKHFGRAFDGIEQAAYFFGLAEAGYFGSEPREDGETETSNAWIALLAELRLHGVTATAEVLDGLVTWGRHAARIAIEPR